MTSTHANAVTHTPSAPSTPSARRQPGLRHLAVILDGNRRWARQRGLPAIDGYRKGAQRVGDLFRWCEDAGIGYVTVRALSLDNLRRPQQDVTPMLEVITTELRRLADARHSRINPIGALDVLPQDYQTVLTGIAADTADVPGVVANVAIAYDGRQEIAHAVRALVSERAEAAETELARHLYTAGQPDPDLIIRTSGEQRLSGFMPWQAAYADYHFVPTCWPDFSRQDFDHALASYAERDRRHCL